MTTEKEKIDPWAWVDVTEPDEVSTEHILKAYCLNEDVFSRVEFDPKKSNANPFWLKLLVDAKSRYVEDAEEGTLEYDKNVLQLRTQAEFAGLKNGGATCYANSILQAWFHNPLIRVPIMEWVPPPDAEDHHFLIELQKLFYRMQYSRQKSIETDQFISSLRLCQHEQQDAQEFSMLLMEKIIKSSPEFKAVFEGLLHGQLKYETKCLACDNVTSTEETFTFLNIGKEESLLVGLADKLADENLTGENQYYCHKCESKSDAVRVPSITFVPDILQLQIMRYIFNEKTFENQKLYTNVSYPQRLDLNAFLGDSVEDISENIYVAHAILNHRGSSASYGHYVANIRHADTGRWFEFNDENVSQAEESEEEQESSRTAYMIIYLRENSLLKQQSDVGTTQYSIQMRELIEQEDEEFIIKLTNIHCLRTQLKIICSTLNDREKHGLGDEGFVPLAWLRHIVKPTLQDAPDESSFQNLICPHEKIKPTLKATIYTPYRVLPVPAVEILMRVYGNSEEPRLVESSLCKECVQIRCKKIRMLSKQYSDSIDSAFLNQKRFDEDFAELKADKRIQIPKAFYKGKRWFHKNFFNEWKCRVKQMAEEMDDFSSKIDMVEASKRNLICDCDGQIMLSPDDKNLKLVPEEVWKIFEVYCKVSDELCAETLKFCSHCKQRNDANKVIIVRQNDLLFKELKKGLVDLLKEKNRPVIGQRGTFYIIPYDFLEAVKYFMLERTGRNPPAHITNEQLLCEHRKLKYPVFYYEKGANISSMILAERDRKLVVLYEDEWTIFNKIFPKDIEIKITVQEDGNILDEDNFCKECGILWWNQAYEAVRDFQEESIVLILRRPSADKNDEDGETPKKLPKLERQTYVSGSTTLRELKETVARLLKIPVQKQRLFFNDKMLADNDIWTKSKMLKDCEVFPQTKIYVEEVAQEEESLQGRNLDAMREQ